MANRRINRQQAYGLSQALIGVPAAPIITTRNPGVTDFAEVGQTWINKSTGGYWVLYSVTSGSANWASGATAAASLTVSGALVAGTTITAGTGLTVTTGGITCTGTIGNTGAITATTTITAGTNLVATAGSVSAGTSVSATTTVTAGTNITSTAGNITATNGNVVISAATKGLTLPGPVRIITGAGAPANGLAVNVGDIYINTTGSSTSTRVYIATAASTWTYIASNA